MSAPGGKDQGCGPVLGMGLFVLALLALFVLGLHFLGVLR